MSAIIQVDRLSKRYRIGKSLQNAEGRHSLFNKIASPFSYLMDSLRPPSEDEILWAIKDISFEAQKGEVLGIVGRNGAGKSTLLKILSRISDPTSGKAVIHGRVGSLLEVGTGFHPELTGLENIYLNGTILGMKRQEISRKFDEIVAFADVEKFLNTPVKRYSSGMYVRLAFAVAAHLETEILFIDEVLAVGDAEFQKRCLNKMGDVAREGRTVLFVSHNMNAVQRLCSRAILVEHGQITDEGDTNDILIHYLSNQSISAQPNQWMIIPADINRSGDGRARFIAIQYSSQNGNVRSQAYPNGPLKFQVEIESDQSRTIDSIAVSINDQYGLNLVNADTVSLGKPLSFHPGRNIVDFQLEAVHLNPGTYTIGLWLANTHIEVFDYIPSAAKFEVIDFRLGESGMGAKADGVVPCKFDAILQ